MLSKVSSVLLWTLSAATIGFGQDSFPGITPGELEQADGITATFTTQGLTLNLTARCSSADRLCPFRAEIHAPPPLFKLIEHVEYTLSPDRPTSPTPITDASTSFRFEAKQMAGEKVYAEVTLRPRGGAPSKVVRLEGTIPFGEEAKPPLPSGLRFEIQYRPWYLEGGAAVGHYFLIWLRGETAALNRIKSVEYQLPTAYFTNPRAVARAETEYMFEGYKPNNASFEIVAALRWKNGTRSTHAIPIRAR
ncbi:MAG TPA: hypothetical protein VJH03_10220 [Blastocatellia bacterium]|nr:hypothetical protein [Blastocatellia bacterium]